MVEAAVFVFTITSQPALLSPPPSTSCPLGVGWGHTLWSAEILCAAAVPLSWCARRQLVPLFLVHNDIFQPLRMSLELSECRCYLWLLWCTDHILQGCLGSICLRLPCETPTAVFCELSVLSYPTVWTPVMAVMHPLSQVRVGQRESFTTTRKRTYKLINPSWISLKDPVHTAQ